MHCKFMLIVSILALLAVTVAPVAAQGDETEWTCPEGFAGETLRILSFTQYIGEEIIPRFEELCDVDVDYDVTDSSEAVLLLLREGTSPYDIIVPSGDVIGRMIEEDLLHELNQDNIPNMDNLMDAFRDPVYDPGNAHSIPYVWGLLGVAYNTEFVGEEITSWEQVWDYEGPVAWQDDLRMTIGTALLLLGYDPNTTNPDELEEARDYLLENGENVVYIAGDDGEVVLQEGTVDIAIEWNGDIVQLRTDCECDTYEFVIPEEGALFYVDNLAIPAISENPELAEAFMDYILDPHIGAENINFIAYGTPNQAALDMELVDEELLNNPRIYPDDDTMATIQTTRDVPDAEELYADIWNEIFARLGQ